MPIRSTVTRSLCLLVPILSGCVSHSPTPIPVESSNQQASNAQPPEAKAGAQGLSEPVFQVPDAAARRESAPMTLTASDGTGLRLVNVTVKGVFEDLLAYTEVHLEFDNPQDRTIEGRFRMALPSQAAVARLAMKIGDTWQEGEMVDRGKARVAFEDALHRKQDPALLEQAPGNEVTARVFPIPAHAHKEIIVAYSQPIRSTEGYAVPLQGLPLLDHLEVVLYDSSGRLPPHRIERKAYLPEGDLVVPPSRATENTVARSPEHAVMRIHPVATRTAEPLGATLFLIDTSASRALGRQQQTEIVGDLLKELARGSDQPIMAAGFDQSVEILFDGPLSLGAVAVRTALQKRRSLGASDLSAALEWARTIAQKRHFARVVLVTDGVITAGKLPGTALRESVEGLAKSGVQRVDAVVIGGLRDENTLAQVVTAGMPRAGAVIDARQGATSVATHLVERVASHLTVQVAGASWWWPKEIASAQAGDEVLVHAELPSGKPIHLNIAGREVPLHQTRKATPELVDRSWAEARIASLLVESGHPGASPTIEKEIVTLSQRHRVMSPFTSLLVLETEQDYARFGIDRLATRGGLSIQAGQLVTGRRAPLLPANSDSTTEAVEPIFRRSNSEDAQIMREPPASKPSASAPNLWGDTIGDSMGAGGLGLTGIGEGGGGRGDGTIGQLQAAAPASGQGFGSGHGRLGGSHRTSSPMLRMGATTVSGRLPPEVIQRIVRQSYGRFRQCYEQGLARNPSAEGRVSVRFTIAREGTVVGARDAGSTLDDPAVRSCVVRAFQGLAFPKPEGGTVSVVYPIIFSPDGRPPLRGTPRTDASQPDAAPELPALSGEMASVEELLERRRPVDALNRATQWNDREPGEILSYVALGRAYEALQRPQEAARAYGSIIDLFPSRADLRRYAGNLLESLPRDAGLDLAIDTYRKAWTDRPDHPASHRLLAYALVKQKRYAEAFDVLLAALGRKYPDGRFRGVDRILREDLGLVGAAWMAALPEQRETIRRRLDAVGVDPATEPSLRFVLTWETDANDVDFHIEDAAGNHAYYQAMELPKGGGQLYADVTTGYGPECFTIPLPKTSRSSSYTLRAHYYSRGPMGFGMGKVEILDHDGLGHLTFEERPYLVMQNQAFVKLGKVTRETAGAP